MGKLDKKTILVTGAAGGIGSAVVSRCLMEGAVVLACDRDPSSLSGQEGSSDAVYGLTKAALLGLTKSCAMNFAPGIRVNAVAPGLVETEMIRSVPAYRLEEYREMERVKEPLRPEDVAATVSFLLSGESRGYTGAVFDLNNGCYLRA